MVQAHDTQLKSKNGDRIPIRLSATWLFDDKGSIIGSVGYFRDLRSLNELEWQRQMLLEASNAIVQVDNLSQGLDNLSKIIVESTKSTFCSILLFSKGHRSLIIQAAYPLQRSDKLVWNPRIGKEVSPIYVDEINRLSKDSHAIVLRKDTKSHEELLSSFIEEISIQDVINSAVIIPIISSDSTLGYCILGEMRSWERSPFSISRLDIGRALTSQAAGFIEKMQLLEEKDQALKQLLRSQNTARVISEVSVLGELQDTLPLITKGILEVLECDAVVLYVYDQLSDKLMHPPTMVGVRHPEKSKADYQVHPDSIVYKILQLEKSYVAENITKDSLFKDKRFSNDEDIKSCIAIPLIVASQKVGVIFANYRVPHVFTNDELQTYELFANQAGIAISNAQLFEQAKKRAEALHVLYEASKVIITSSLSLDDILQTILEQARILTSVRGVLPERSYLAFVDDQKIKIQAVDPPEDYLKAKKKVGIIDIQDQSQINNIGTIDIIGRVVLTGRSQLVIDVSEDSDYIAIFENIKSVLAVPIIASGEVIGVIRIEHSYLNGFDEDDMQNLEALAAQAAIAILNARAYEELKITKGRVGASTALAWMGMAESSWRHSIDSNAQTIIEQLLLLESDLKLSGYKNKKISDRLEIIDRLAHKIKQKPITPPLNLDKSTELVAINALIGSRASQLRKNMIYKEIDFFVDLQLADNATVKVNREWMRRAYDILVDNAIKAVADNNYKEITIGTRFANDGCEIFVNDNGPGIREQIIPKIGLEIISKSTTTKGQGIGLVICKAIVQAYDGDLKIGCTGLNGTSMIIWLPIARDGTLSKNKSNEL